MPQMRTPGVYIEEKNAFPNAVVEVATAVPAFIGYTEKASRGSADLTNVPTRISSLAEFEQCFGGPPQTLFDLVGTAVTPVATSRFLLAWGMRLFFDNGGGPCWTVSVGGYRDGGDWVTRTAADFEQAWPALAKEQEPTMVVVPDAVLLSLARVAGGIGWRAAALRGATRPDRDSRHLRWLQAAQPWRRRCDLRPDRLSQPDHERLSELRGYLLSMAPHEHRRSGRSRLHALGGGFAQQPRRRREGRARGAERRRCLAAGSIRSGGQARGQRRDAAGGPRHAQKPDGHERALPARHGRHAGGDQRDAAQRRDRRRLCADRQHRRRVQGACQYRHRLGALANRRHLPRRPGRPERAVGWQGGQRDPHLSRPRHPDLGRAHAGRQQPGLSLRQRPAHADHAGAVDQARGRGLRLRRQ